MGKKHKHNEKKEEKYQAAITVHKAFLDSSSGDREYKEV